MLWEEKIYWCAYIIAGCSVAFPYIKLFCLAVIWMLPKHGCCSRIVLRQLALAGRISLLDVFVVIFIMIMAYD
jgi:uncharacterized paraquat-inducible protein A